MGRVFLVELDDKAYRCKFCDTPVALADDILSRSFSCRKGRAYLFENVVNVSCGPEENRMIAPEKNQKYKEGKAVLERWRITEDVSEDFNVESRSSDPEYT